MIKVDVKKISIPLQRIGFKVFLVTLQLLSVLNYGAQRSRAVLVVLFDKSHAISDEKPGVFFI